MAAFTKNIIDTRLAIYTLAAGALASGSAHAVPTKSPSSFPVSAEDSIVYIDIDGDGQDDFRLYAVSYEDCTYNGGYAYFNAEVSDGGVLGVSGYAGLISNGSSVSGSSLYDIYSSLVTCNYDLGEFPPPTAGYVGVKFSIGKDIHYGYMAVETRVGSVIATVLGACYESTPDRPINVGACNRLSREAVSVPVGGLIPLSLAALALGAAASRRRRKTQQ
jgi:hypothetical protein